MSYCIDCGRELPASGAFCGRCGAPVQRRANREGFPSTGGVARSHPTPPPSPLAPATPPAAAPMMEPRLTPELPVPPPPPATGPVSEPPAFLEDSRAVSHMPVPTAYTNVPSPAEPPAEPGSPAPIGGLQAQVDAGSVQASLRDGALVASGLFAVSLLIAAVVLNIIGSATSGDWFRVGGWVQGMTFRGSLNSSLSASAADVISLAGTVHATAQPGLLLVGCLAAAALLAVRSERYQPSANLASALVRSALAGGGAAAVSVAVALVTRGSLSTSADSLLSSLSDFGVSSSLSVGVGVPSVLVGTLVFVTLASAAARTAVGWRRIVLPRWQQEAASWLPAARGVVEFAVVSVGLGLVAGVMILLGYGAQVSDWLTALADLPLDVAALVAFGAGAVVSARATSALGGGDFSFGTFVGTAPGWAWTLLLLPLAAAVVAGARTVLRRPPIAKVSLAVSWRFSLLMLAGAVVLTFLSSITASGSVSAFSGGARLGLGWASVILSALAWGTLIPVVGFYAVRLTMGASPHLLVRLATIGRGQLNSEWAAALGQADRASSPRPVDAGPTVNGAARSPLTPPGSAPAVAASAGPVRNNAPTNPSPNGSKSTKKSVWIGGIVAVAAAAVFMFAIAGNNGSTAASFCKDYSLLPSVQGTDSASLKRAVDLTEKLAAEAPASAKADLKLLAQDLQQAFNGDAISVDGPDFEAAAARVNNIESAQCAGK
jgi:hypothetical protein